MRFRASLRPGPPASSDCRTLAGSRAARYVRLSRPQWPMSAPPLARHAASSLARPHGLANSATRFGLSAHASSFPYAVAGFATPFSGSRAARLRTVHRAPTRRRKKERKNGKGGASWNCWL
jgi:hypothetical protein